jgi:geranylgeranylglycerol-phosphate geranylgeranyltransferase
LLSAWSLHIHTAQTKPGRPLVTGEVRPDTVKLVLKWGYAIHLTLLCLVQTAPMRLWVLGNTLLTYLYSVHLKPVTGIKNLVCAAIVAMAIGLGALAVDGSLGSLRAVWRPMVAVGGLIWHREMVMDIQDMEGDGLAGVRTVPVAFGARRALKLSLLPLGASVAAAVTVGSGARALAATVPLGIQAALAVRALQGGFARPRMMAAIELAPLWLASTLVALTL